MLVIALVILRSVLVKWCLRSEVHDEPVVVSGAGLGFNPEP